MGRIYDKFLADYKMRSKLPDELHRRLVAAEIIRGDEVLEDFLREPIPDKVQMLELPNIAPTFDHMFLDFKLSKKNRSIDLFSRWTGEGLGVLVSAMQAEERAKWVLNFTVFIQAVKEEVWPAWEWVIPIREDGTISYQESEGKKALYAKQLGNYPGWGPDEIPNLAGIALHVSLITISLMNCKNVVLQTKKIDPKINKSRVRKGRLIYVDYYTLEVHPVGRTKTGASSKTDQRMPLHLCRGHFKDYRDGEGLFGKLKGLYWWPAHARGDASVGINIKDYDVKKD